jgi:hypothetical protein
MKVSGGRRLHGHASELERSLPALVGQVDETLVIANVPGSIGVLLTTCGCTKIRAPCRCPRT